MVNRHLEVEPQARSRLFLAISSPEMLQAGWMRVAANGGASGGDGQTLGVFARRLGANIARLSAELRTGLYAPGRDRRVDIPKPSGGVRSLRIPSIRDRVAMTSCANTLGPLLEPTFEDSSFGYRPGRSIQAAARRVHGLRQEGFDHVVEGDIDDFFDNVPHARLLDKLSAVIADEDVRDLVATWLAAAEPDGVGIAQGSPLSPLLANLYLDAVDEAMKGDDVAFVRYADDFVVLTRSRGSAEATLDRLRSVLGAHDLTLDAAKTRIVRYDDGFHFLGHAFDATGVTAGPKPSEGSMAKLAATTTASPGPAEDGLEGLGGDPHGRHAERLRVLYLMGAGVVLTTAGEAFRILGGGGTIADVPPATLDRIEISSRAEATSAALRRALTHGISVAFVSAGGRTLGFLDPPAYDRSSRHLAQARVVLDTVKSVELARAVVGGRVRNQRALLHRLNRRRKSPDVANAIAELGRILRKLTAARTIPELRGHEGNAARVYWPAFGASIPDWPFETRNRRPPRDAVNLVLSFLAGLLSRDFAALVPRAGLHPGFGVLHVAAGQDWTVAADMIEEFRAPIVEALTVTLFNNRILGRDDFGAVASVDETEASETRFIRALPETTKRIVKAYEAWVDREVTSHATGEKTTWRGVFEDQIRLYAGCIAALAAGGDGL